MKPNTNKGAYLPLADPATQQAQQGQYQSGTGQPVTTAAGAPVMSQQAVQERTSFAKSISEMRRIAGLE